MQKVRYLHVKIAESEVILAHPVIRGPCPVDTREVRIVKKLCVWALLYIYGGQRVIDNYNIGPDACKIRHRPSQTS